MKDFRIKVRAYNNHLLTRREAFPATQKQLALWAGVPLSAYAELESLKRPAWSARDGYWTDAAIKLAHFYDVDPQEIFPEEVKHVTAKRIEHELSAAEALYFQKCGPSLSQPDVICQSKDLLEKTQEVLADLTLLEEGVLCMRFGIDMRGDGETLEAIGAHLGVGKERVRQIEARALRKLRHPDRARKLLPFVRE